MKKKFQKIVFQMVSSFLILMTIYFSVQLCENFLHNWSANAYKHEEALVYLSKICSESELIQWPAIYETCRQNKEIVKRSPLWETIVDTSKMFHICYKKKVFHDENKIHGHDHLKKDNHENDDEIDCSFFTYFLIGIITATIIIVYYLNFCRNNKSKNKLKSD